MPKAEPETLAPGEYSVYYVGGLGKKKRQIQEPNAGLKWQQRNFLDIVQAWVNFPECVQGGVPGRGVMTALQMHQNAKVVFKTDIKSFFRSTTKQHIIRALRLLPWRESVKTSIITDLDRVCLFPQFNQLILPTGAPTSPFLGNIAASILDQKILHYLREMDKYGHLRGIYTRYIDDITISFPGWQVDSPALEREIKRSITAEVYDLIKSSGYQPAEDKTQWMKIGRDNMEILGIAQDNQGVFRVPRKLRRTMRAALHNCRGKPDTRLAAQLEYIKNVNTEQYKTLVLAYL